MFTHRPGHHPLPFIYPFAYMDRTVHWPQTMRSSPLWALFFLFTLLISLSGCQQLPEFDDIYTRVSAQTLSTGMSIPVPTDAPILTISGAVGSTNSGDMIVMDRATIEQVGLVEYQVLDPFEQRPIVYRGVLMRDLLALWQPDPQANMMKLTALNDYVIEIPLEEFSTYPILFAMQADGEIMDITYRGPAMLVYPVDQYEFDSRVNQRKWIWQIKSIEVY